MRKDDICIGDKLNGGMVTKFRSNEEHQCGVMKDEGKGKGTERIGEKYTGGSDFKRS